MKRTLSILLPVVLGVALTAACETASENPVARTTGETSAMTSSQLESAIKAKFSADAQLNAADLSVSADAERNEATLTGTVETQELRLQAVAAAKSARAGLLITDKIDVKPREVTRETFTEDLARRERERAKEIGDKIGDTLDDAWLHTKIVAKLVTNNDTPERKINVDVSNNVVTLRGTVDSAEQKAEAERTAKETEGVKRVINQLKIARK
ncbi:MAG: BON domain-containing protein [Acidobacteria bacterium]|nr:BON domain-containing protein [Acidobacteriota bacterium]